MSVVKELAAERRWILTREVHAADGKIEKLPIDVNTGRLFARDSGAALNPDHWMTGPEVEGWLATYGEGHWPGLVITDDCGIFFLDLDHCRYPNGGWMPHAVSFLNRFPAAACETSISRTGRHVFIRYSGELPEHGSNNDTYCMQGYSHSRFALTTGIDYQGSLNHDYSKELVQFLEEFFPPKPHHTPAEWRNTPVDEWSGPEDDNELLGRASASNSAKAIFGSGASFRDLWYATPEVMERAFPTENNRDSYNRSGADQALCNHLAFWTGNNCERIRHFMKGSALVRPKWDREDYIQRTILNSCTSQKEWYNDRKASEVPQTAVVTPPTEMDVETPVGTVPTPDLPLVIVELAGFGSVPIPPPVPTPPPVPKAPPYIVPPEPLKVGELPPVGSLVTTTLQRQMFTGMCYVQDIHAVQMIDGYTATKDRFDARYGGYQYVITADGQRPTKSAWDAFLQSEVYRFPRVETQYFSPGEATGTVRIRERRKEINSYQPIEIKRLEGDPAPFLDLMRRMLPKGNDAQILLYYMAACCQHLGTKFKWAPFIQGCKGNGKTTIGKVLEYCMGYRYTHWAKADQIGEKFNSVFVDKTLVVVDEMYAEDMRELQETLKLLITAERIEVRPMQCEKTMKDICFNMILFSNYQHGVRIDRDERRYAPFFCAQQAKADKARDGLTKPYFIALYDWLKKQDGFAIVYDYLMAMQIPDELNPATHCIEAPETTSTEVAAIASLGGVEQELVEAIKQKSEGFRQGWISSHAVDLLLHRCGKDRVIPRSQRAGLVTALGYVPHPALVSTDGVCSAPLPDGSLTRLYVLRGHQWGVDYLSHEQVRDGFLEAQKKG